MKPLQRSNVPQSDGYTKTKRNKWNKLSAYFISKAYWIVQQAGIATRMCMRINIYLYVLAEVLVDIPFFQFIIFQNKPIPQKQVILYNTEKTNDGYDNEELFWEDQNQEQKKAGGKN